MPLPEDGIPAASNVEIDIQTVIDPGDIDVLLGRGGE